MLNYWICQKKFLVQQLILNFLFCRELPYLGTYVQVVLFQQMLFHPMLLERRNILQRNTSAHLVAQIVAHYQPNKDTVTLVASMMLAVTCKPVNLVSVFKIKN